MGEQGQRVFLYQDFRSLGPFLELKMYFKVMACRARHQLCLENSAPLL